MIGPLCIMGSVCDHRRTNYCTMGALGVRNIFAKSIIPKKFKTTFIPVSVHDAQLFLCINTSTAFFFSVIVFYNFFA
jgi:hypothetical protein